MCNLCSITTNQAAIIALFRVINRYVGNLPPMAGVFTDFPALFHGKPAGAFRLWVAAGRNIELSTYELALGWLGRYRKAPQTTLTDHAAWRDMDGV